MFLYRAFIERLFIYGGGGLGIDIGKLFINGGGGWLDIGMVVLFMNGGWSGKEGLFIKGGWSDREGLFIKGGCCGWLGIGTGRLLDTGGCCGCFTGGGLGTERGLVVFVGGGLGTETGFCLGEVTEGLVTAGDWIGEDGFGWEDSSK